MIIKYSELIKLLKEVQDNIFIENFTNMKWHKSWTEIFLRLYRTAK